MARSKEEGLAIIGHFPQRKKAEGVLKLLAVIPEYDFTGVFWQNHPIGQNLREFAQNLLDLPDMSFPQPATTVSGLLKLTNDKQRDKVISELAESGILRGIKPGITRGYVLTLPQILACDLVLHTLERGHSVQETVEIISKAVKGTFLSDSLDKLKAQYPFQNVHSGDKFFSLKSHWQKLSPQDEPTDTVIPLSGRVFDRSKVDMINVDKGGFWRTSLGKQVEKFAESQDILKKLSCSLTANRIAMELVTNSQQKTASAIIEMVRRGLLVHPTRRLQEERNPSLVLPHLFISGLILSSLDHGESLARVSVHLKDLLKGTSLEPYMQSVREGEHDDKYPIKTKRTTHLKKESPWSQFFLPEEDQQIADVMMSDSADDDEGRTDWIPNEYRPIPGKPLEIDIGVLKKFGEFDAQELAMLRMEFSKHNADTDSINVNRLLGFPPKLLGVLAFVSAAVNRKFMLYETLLDDFTNYDFKRSLLACEQLMVSYGVNSLKDMFKILMEEIEKDPKSYWNAEQVR